MNRPVYVPHFSSRVWSVWGRNICFVRLKLFVNFWNLSLSFIIIKRFRKPAFHRYRVLYDLALDQGGHDHFFFGIGRNLILDCFNDLEKTFVVRLLNFWRVLFFWFNDRPINKALGTFCRSRIIFGCEHLEENTVLIATVFFIGESLVENGPQGGILDGRNVGEVNALAQYLLWSH